MQRNNQPHFYKYLSPEAAIAVLGNCSFKWSHPALFNDPFDNALGITMTEDVEASAAESHEHFMKLLEQDSPVEGFDSPQLNAVVEWLRQVVKATGYVHTPEDLAYLREGAIEGEENARRRLPEVNAHLREVLSDTSIFCMSEDNADEAMWSYYAANHTGIVLKLVPPHSDSFLTVAQKVKYVEKPTPFSAKDFMDTPSATSKALAYVTLTKSTKWAHEKEWRAVSGLRNKANQFEIIPFNPQELSSVYLGCRMSNADRDSIVGLVRNRFSHVQVFQASPNHSTLSMDFTLVE